MSITSAMYSATSGLTAQSKALASISSNIANTSTTGFKGTVTEFTSYINKTTTVDEQVGGVIASNTRNINSQGEIQTSSVTTNLAVNGEGFFVVSNETADGGTYFTRNGSFSADSDGYLVNSEDYYLYGWKLADDGTVGASNKTSVDSLEAINLSNIKGTPKATTTESLEANLPSDAETGDDFTTDIEMFDALGNSHSVTLTWTKTGDNSWSLDASDPVSSSDSTATTGTISGFPIDITFNSDGSLASASQNGTAVDPSAISYSVGGWTTGASDSTVSLDLGTADGTDGLTQYASGESDPDIGDWTATQNGYEPGTLTGTTIDGSGVVRATFDNGETRAIYQIPIATFANADGLDSESGTTFTQTYESGNYQLRTAGDGKAGDIEAGSLESSTVELTDEFSRMIVAQQAYSAASKVMTTAQDMLDTLISMKR
ncbi:flagellar hook-basal body protein [Azospirillum thiophilum]|uniref:Flagellar hook protein FlgE n=1 Tax=Azospirillum thiophilum TaxID=528244 RepID=A0AAC8VZI3_9PROT|nr:flagellar hook protein FlgE [Azospirillum thiophilum]ALG72300.1 flagellar hook-basal body protein [Azospirillum thiophilum]KJR61264.1 flagellar hook-basal body protein [Azospirillum thiophilum]